MFEETEESKKALLAFEESVRSVSEQLSSINEFRSRASVLLTLANGFAGILALSSPVSPGIGLTCQAVTFWMGLAGLAFVTWSVASIYGSTKLRLNPMGFGEIRFESESDDRRSEAFEEFQGTTDSYEEMLWTYAEYHQQNYSLNAAVTDRMAHLMRNGLLALGLLVLSWTVNALVLEHPVIDSLVRVELVESE